MEIQTMGSQGGDTQQSNFQSLARKSSLYSLTLNEVQNQLGDLGKPLSSMNLDEFLKNMWAAEANQGIELETQNANGVCEIALDSALKHQTSLTLPRALSNKTVDEVWGDIQHGKKKNSEVGKVQERKPTLGEMTLEDFLVKAGIVSEASADKKTDPVMGIDPMEASPQNFPQKVQLSPQNMNGVYVPGRLVSQSVPLNAVPLLDVEYLENPLTISSSLMGSLSDAQTIGQKRVAEGDIIEKTVERRQKRMIKNRESAARSRARKQAYTNELENKVSRLEEENERLKKQKELEKILPSALPPEPKYQLRRTISAPV